MTATGRPCLVMITCSPVSTADKTSENRWLASRAVTCIMATSNVELVLHPGCASLLSSVARSGRRGVPIAPVVRRGEIELGAERDDPAGIDIAHAAVISELDSRQVDRFGDPRHLVDLVQVVRQIVIVGEPAQIAFEVAVIDRVKPHQGRKQPQIGLGEAVADQIALPAEPLLESVERREQLAETFFVSLLGSGEAAAIDPIVDRVVDKSVDLV